MGFLSRSVSKVVVKPMSDDSNIPSLPKRRLLVSEPGAAYLPMKLGAASPLPELEPAKPPQEIEDRKGETRRVVKRLMAIIEEHRVSAQRIGVTLDAAALEIVLNSLEAETRMEDPQPILQSSANELLRYVVSSLYEELLAEPSNILSPPTSPRMWSATKRWRRPSGRNAWRRCGKS